MAIRHYCTLFDRNYLFKGVTMLRSIARHSPGARIHVLCMDDITAEMLRRLAIPGVITLPLASVETDDVLTAKKTRSIAEYCWTLSAVLLWHVMQDDTDIDLITYLDADLMFFSNVEPIFDEMGSASILAIEHRYTRALQHLLPYGRFNVQWVSFRRDAAGLACLKTWRDQCVEWCFALVEEHRHGDQKYLDAWPATYGAAFHSLQHAGAGLAPWNYPNHRIEQTGADTFLVDGAPLIFYHFHQFQIMASGGFKPFRNEYDAQVGHPAALYGSYWATLQGEIAQVQALDPAFASGFNAASKVAVRKAVSRLLPVQVKNVLKRMGLRAW